MDEELLLVRRNVVHQLQRRQAASRKNWIWAAGLIAAAVVIAALVIPRQRPTQQATHPDVITTAFLTVPHRSVVQPSIPNLESVGPRRVKRRRSTPGIRAVTLLARSGEPQMLKMTTSDPDVVILWQLNGRTQGQ